MKPGMKSKPGHPLFQDEISSRLLVSLAITLTAACAFLAWSSIAPLSSAIVANGMIVPDSRTKTVQHLDGGIISKILVTDGSIVEAGQDLLALDDTRARTAVALLTSQYHAALSLESRLIAERDGADHISFPDDLITSASIPEVNQTMASERNRFVARHKALTGETAILQQRVAQLEEEITGYQAQQHAANGQLALLAEEINVVRDLVNAGHERKPRLLALQRAAREIEGERGLYIGQIARARQGIGEAHLRISQLSVTRMREVADELKDVQVRVLDLKERLNAAEDSLTRTLIKAPHAGVVVRLGYFTTGGVIPAAAPILNIVPKDDRTIVEARIRPEDIDSVQLGMEAQVWPTAFNLRQTQALTGTIKDVSADRLVEHDSDRSYYLARVEIQPDSATQLPNGIKSLIAGMPAEVIIETRARTFADYLMKPITGSIRRAFREE